MRWFGPGTTLRAAGFNIKDPCVYASEGTDQRFNAEDPSEIFLDAAVRKPTGPAPDMGYWPWFSRIAPEQRFLYLHWLASGKATLPREEGHLFLYYYGLERRLLADGQDRALVLREVIRLRRLDDHRRGAKEGASFRRYTTAFLWFQVASAPETFDARSLGVVCEMTESWHEEILPAALSWFLHHKLPVPSSIAFRVAQADARSIQSVVTKRVGEKFTDLFSKRFAEKFGNGMAIKASKRPRRFTYRPASAGLSEYACNIADATALPSQFAPLADLWNSCVEDLRKLSKVGGASEGADSNIETWEALPSELREGVDHPLTRGLQALAAEDARAGQPSIVAVGRIATLARIEQRARLTAAQSRRVAELVEHTCHCIEPDPRLTSRSLGWDEPVALFLRWDDAPVNLGRYNGAACMLRLGLAVASADGTVDEAELGRLTQQIEAAFQLSDSERRRLEALRGLLARSGFDLGQVAGKLEKMLSPAQRQSVGRLLVAIAASDGVIDRKEQAALRKCFRALGLAAEVLEQTIVELVPESGLDMVTVQSARPVKPGETIPPPKETRLRLNREAISAIMAETREVAKILAEAMEAVEPDEDTMTIAAAVVQTPGATMTAPSSAATLLAVDSQLKRPPGRYGPMFEEIITRDRWSSDDAASLAGRHGCMLAGAIETINDWSFSAFGSPLLEDNGSEVSVDRSIL
ncbi:MAG: TerB N-terminal domain-containing protein [Phycisphaerae bacterium]|nr:TerB N-terminal domain-containing protein [Phycisphaerae bacterium]